MTIPPGAVQAGFGIYIHWPFCLSKCPYCDFNSHVRDTLDHARWRVALLADLAHQRERFGTQSVTSLFFGGGTPSLMDTATVGDLIDAVVRDFPCADDLEITLEANPTSVEAEKFRGFRTAGVNRVSIGVQALDDDALKFLGRKHSAQEARHAIGLARAHFPRMSFDLIYARPDQDAEGWKAELRQALALAPNHLSLYQLTFEPGTPMGEAHARGRLPGLPDDVAADLFEVTQSLCDDAGFPAYEISNHSRPGTECRHNLTYWRYGDYLGLGPGAHGRIKGNATVAHRTPEAWLQAVERHGHGLESIEPLDAPTQGREYLLMGMRLTEGISARRYETLCGAPLDAEGLDALADLGLLNRHGDRVAATGQGRLVLNQLIETLAR